MVITLGSDLEAALTKRAQQEGIDPETLALDAVRQRVMPANEPVVPQDDWERRLLAIATDCGVSLSHEALSSEGLYEE
jgi:hypothetical protein